MTDQNQSAGPEFADIPSIEDIREMKRNATAEAEAPQEVIEEAPEPSVEMPSKFQGKSIEQVLESYQNLESQLGRQAQEMGTLRSLNDQLLDLKVTERGQSQLESYDPEITADDVLNNPGESIAAAAAPQFEATNSRVDQIEAQLALSAFESRHPSYLQDQNDPAFQQFVNGSNYRSSLAEKLVRTGDLTAAEELWGAWEETKPSGAVEATIQPTAAEVDERASATAMASGGGQGGTPSRKPVSRAELANIRIHDEDRYYSPEFQEYIQHMYQNRLVK